MSSATSAPMRIFQAIKRQSSLIFGRDQPSSPTESESEEEKFDDDPVKLPYKMGYLTAEMEEEARHTLNETDETKKACLTEMRQLIEKEENLVCRTDDNFLLQFLRARKYNVKRAFKLLQNYFQFRKEYSEIYDNLKPEVVKQLLLHNFLGYLTHRDRYGCIVFVFKIGQWSPELDPFEEVFRAVTGLLVAAAEDPATQVTGFRCIIDFRGLSWKQIKYGTPQNILLFIRSTQFCFPARFKAIHIFSENRLFNLLWSICTPCLTSKLKKRIIHHGKDVEALKDYIHPSLLPTEYGGTQGPFENSSRLDVINSEESWMVDMLKYGYK